MHDTKTIAEIRQEFVALSPVMDERMRRFHNAGREWQPQGSPEEVRIHDFMDLQLGKVTPYGVHDLASKPRRLYSKGVAVRGTVRVDFATRLTSSSEPSNPPGKLANPF